MQMFDDYKSRIVFLLAITQATVNNSLVLSAKYWANYITWCLVRLDDGRIWKRDIDQIHRVGSEIPIPKTDIIPHYYDVTENRDRLPRHTQAKMPNGTDVEPPADDTKLTEDNDAASQCQSLLTAAHQFRGA